MSHHQSQSITAAASQEAQVKTCKTKQVEELMSMMAMVKKATPTNDP
jgi:hypothetical protein